MFADAQDIQLLQIMPDSELSERSETFRYGVGETKVNDNMCYLSSRNIFVL